MNRLKKNSTPFWSAVFSVLVLLSGYNYTSNGHYHQLADGQIVFHVHPFASGNEENAPQHTHSSSEYVSLLLLTNVGFDDYIFLIINTFRAFDFLHFSEELPLLYNQFPFGLSSKRAPPVLG